MSKICRQGIRARSHLNVCQGNDLTQSREAAMAIRKMRRSYHNGGGSPSWYGLQMTDIQNYIQKEFIDGLLDYLEVRQWAFEKISASPVGSQMADLQMHHYLISPTSSARSN